MQNRWWRWSRRRRLVIPIPTPILPSTVTVQRNNPIDIHHHLASMALTRYALRSRSISRPSISKLNFVPKLAAYSTRATFGLSPQSFGSSSRSTIPKFSQATSRLTVNYQSVRFGSGGSLSKDDIQRRILEVLGSFEKCDPAKVGGNCLLNQPVSATYTSYFYYQQITPTASFTSDLGLDSLDAVEVVMAIEEVRSDLVSIFPPVFFRSCQMNAIGSFDRSSRLKYRTRKPIKSPRSAKVRPASPHVLFLHSL